MPARWMRKFAKRTHGDVNETAACVYARRLPFH